MKFEQGVLAASGLGLAASGLATIANPSFLNFSVGLKEAPRLPRKVTNLLGLALFGWGLGKLSVKRGYEKAFCQLSLAPMLGILPIARLRGRRVLLVQAALSGMYAYIGFGPSRLAVTEPFLQHLPGVLQGKGVHLI